MPISELSYGDCGYTLDSLQASVQRITQAARDLSPDDLSGRSALRDDLNWVIANEGCFSLNYKEACKLLRWPGEAVYVVEESVLIALRVDPFAPSLSDEDYDAR